MLSRAGPVRIALLHPQGAWVEALELLLLQRDDVDVVMAHTSPDWVRGSVESGVDVLVVALWEADGFRPEDIGEMRRRWPGLAVVVVSDVTDTEVLVATLPRWRPGLGARLGQCGRAHAGGPRRGPRGDLGSSRSADGAAPDVAHERGRQGTGPGCPGRALGAGTGDPASASPRA